MKATLGPWRVSPFEINTNGATRMVMGADDFSVVWVGERTAEENHANALLIAAAPDLLEACKRLVNAAYKPCGHAYDCVCAGDLARESISKAEGL